MNPEKKQRIEIQGEQPGAGHLHIHPTARKERCGTGFHCPLDKSVERGKGEGRFFVVMMGLKCDTTILSVTGQLLGGGAGERHRETGREPAHPSTIVLFVVLSFALVD